MFAMPDVCALLSPGVQREPVSRILFPVLTLPVLHMEGAIQASHLFSPPTYIIVSDEIHLPTQAHASYFKVQYQARENEDDLTGIIERLTYVMSSAIFSGYLMAVSLLHVGSN